MRASILQKQKSRSPLGSLKRLQPTAEGTGKSKSLFFSLNLTTLIDAFCILVIFLLSNMNSQIQTLQASKTLILPSAARTEAIEPGVVVRVELDGIFMNNEPVAKEQIAKALLDAKKEDGSSIIIQADRNSDYENIGLVLRAGGQAGYEKYVFAVLPGT